MKKLVMYYDRPKYAQGKAYGNAVRIRPETYEMVREICDACRMTAADVLDVLISFAIDNMELKERPVFDITFGNAEEEEGCREIEDEEDA